MVDPAVYSRYKHSILKPLGPHTIYINVFVFYKNQTESSDLGLTLGAKEMLFPAVYCPIMQHRFLQATTPPAKFDQPSKAVLTRVISAPAGPSICIQNCWQQYKDNIQEA